MQLILVSCFFIFQKETGNKKPEIRGSKNKRNKKLMKKPGDSGFLLLIYFSFYINILVNPGENGRFTVNFLFFLFLFYLIY